MEYQDLQKQQQQQRQRQQHHRTLFKEFKGTKQSRKPQKVQEDDETIQRTTALRLENIEKNSVFFPQTNASGATQSTIPCFTPSQIELDRVIGMGQYGIVLEVRAIHSNIATGDRSTNRTENPLLMACRGPLQGVGETQAQCHHLNTQRFEIQYSQPNVKKFVEKRKTLMTCLASPGKSGNQNESPVCSSQQKLYQPRESQSTQSSTRDGTENNGNQTMNHGSTSNQEENSLVSTGGIDIDDSLEQEGANDAGNSCVKVCRHCLCNDGGKRDYAVKQIRKDLYPKKKMEAAIDLAREAKFLTHCTHPNIIKLRATVAHPGQTDFMIVLDRLKLTLYDKMCEWKESTTWLGIGDFWNQHRFGSGNSLLMERLLALYDIAQAMKYLHKNMIIFRDLKPENVALDCTSVMQLFDFGLAKELKAVNLVEAPDGFKATGLTGTPRIMAPEVIQCQNYGLSADVYSFGILFWEVFACQKAIFSLDFATHCEHVVMKGKRPQRLRRSCIPEQLGNLMEECWCADRTKRPNFESVCEHLESEIVTLNQSSSSYNSLSDRFKQFSILPSVGNATSDKTSPLHQ